MKKGTTVSHLAAAPSPRLHVSRRARFAWLAAGAALVAAAVAEILRVDAGAWQLAVFALAPDLALLPLASRRTAPGQLDPRGVPLYNGLHRFAGPVALGIVAVLVLPAGWLVAALAWGAHVAFDRAAGYGLRGRDGWQR